MPRLTFVRRSSRQVILIISLAFFAAILCVQAGFAAFARERNPQLALAVAPWDARAMSAWAAQLQVIRLKAGDPEAIRLARAALVRDATLPIPYRVLGFAREAAGDVAGAERLLGFANKLSRRDYPTQLWLINRAVDRNDVPTAVEHFDIALRTSDAAPEMLFPILANALSEPEVVAAVAPRLLTAPWGQDFVTKAIDDGPSVPGLLLLAEAMERQHRPFAPETMRQLANRLVEAKAYGLLQRLRAISAARPIGRQGVSDPMFNHPTGVPSFDWAFDGADTANVKRGSDSGETSGISFDLADTRVATQLARQLLTLSPGSYVLGIRGASNIADAERAPVWSIRCAESGQQLGQVELTGGAVATLRRTKVVVPPHNCTAQFLIFSTRPAQAAGSANGRVLAVSITPA